MAETLTFRPSKENVKLLDKLRKLAKEDNRSLNNYIETILLSAVERASKPS